MSDLFSYVATISSFGNKHIHHIYDRLCGEMVNLLADNARDCGRERLI